jgi:predicted O-methyltransferase YrrM
MLGDGGHITTIEAYQVFADMAERNFLRHGVSDQVTLLRGNASAILETLSGPYDFIFIDGSKQDYLRFSLKAIEMLAPNGMIVIDDIFFHGDAINDEPTSTKGRGCKETLEFFRDFPNCRKSIIPAWNGTLLLYGFNGRK